MATKSRYGDLSAAIEDAAELPPEMTTLAPANRFAKAREAINHQPNMPPLANREVAAVLAIDPKRGEEYNEYEVVPLAQIHENPFNARQYYDAEAIDKLALSMAQDGQLQPGIATIRDGKYILLGGHYRYKALKKANISTMKLLVRKDIEDRDLYRLSYKENDERHPQTAVDNAYAWQKLLDEKVYEQASDIAEAIGVSEGQISKTLTILKLPSSVIEFARANPQNLGVSILYELHQLVKMSSEEVTLTMAQNVAEGTATRNDITELRAKLASPKQRKAHATSRKYKLKGGAGQVGTMKEWTDGRVVLDLKIEDEAEREAWLKEVKERFKVV